jgi:hypothetical protein
MIEAVMHYEEDETNENEDETHENEDGDEEVDEEVDENENENENNTDHNEDNTDQEENEDDTHDEVIIRNILKMIRETLAQEYEKVYAYGTQEYRKLADVWDRRFGRLSPECDRQNYPDLEARVHQILPRLDLTQLCQIVDRHAHLLNQYEPPCHDYPKEDLLELLDELVHYLPKLELCNIGSMTPS